MSTCRQQISPDNRNNFLSWLILTLIILFTVVVRLRLLDFPLERDEGEYAYLGQLILQGIPPFSQAYSMKLPGAGLGYALIMLLFGQTITGIHLGLLLVNCMSIFLLFEVVKRLSNPNAGLVAALSYAVLSLSPGVLGFAAHATHFVVLTALAGTFLLLKGFGSNGARWWLASGFFFGLSFIMKQHAIFLVLFGVCAIVLETFKSPPVRFKTAAAKILTFCAAAVLPYLLLVIFELLLGNFGKFWFWTAQYASKYATALSFEIGYNVFKINFTRVISAFEILWVIAGIGLVIIFLDKRISNSKSFIVAYILFSVLAVCPGFYFREHYFIILLPAASLLIGLTIDYFDFLLSKTSKLLGYVPIALLLTAITSGLYTDRNYFFLEEPTTLSHLIYGANPFPESIKIAEYVKANTRPGDRIAVLGSEPQIYFYSQRLAASGYIYMYGLLEEHNYNLTMQKEMINEIESSAPKYIIFVNVYQSWLVRPTSEKYIFEWLDHYSANYEVVGNVDIISPQETRYIWGERAAAYRNGSNFFIVIFKRK